MLKIQLRRFYKLLNSIQSCTSDILNCGQGNESNQPTEIPNIEAIKEPSSKAEKWKNLQKKIWTNTISNYS